MGVFFASQKRVLLLLSTLTFSLIINSSAYGQSLSDSDLVSVGLLAILIILILAAVAIAGNSLVSMAAVRSKSDYKTVPSPANDGKEYPLHTFKKGMDISIKGESEPKVIDKHTSRYGIQPINFHNLQPIPKLVPEDGDEVLAGDPLFFDKRFPDVFFVSPVSGEMAGIVRGAKRAITQVMVLADKEIRHRKLNSPDLATVDRETLREFLKKNGGWPLFLQRPYNIIPERLTIHCRQIRAVQFPVSDFFICQHHHLRDRSFSTPHDAGHLPAHRRYKKYIRKSFIKEKRISCQNFVTIFEHQFGDRLEVVKIDRLNAVPARMFIDHFGLRFTLDRDIHSFFESMKRILFSIVRRRWNRFIITFTSDCRHAHQTIACDSHRSKYQNDQNSK